MGDDLDSGMADTNCICSLGSWNKPGQVEARRGRDDVKRVQTHGAAHVRLGLDGGATGTLEHGQ
jgi:hypothetical protein